MVSEYIPFNLPPDFNFETIKILKKVNSANKSLAELKGVSKTIPNIEILINSLVLQEAKDSSEIENIITTHDELYKSFFDTEPIDLSTKEVKNYTFALKKGFERIQESKIFVIKHIVEIQEILENNKAGIRKQIGTNLRNSLTNEIIYIPPQDFETINKLLKNLENYINIDDETDDLIKMAVIHYQFETIHPFYDGNGRTGRIINVLYLVLKGLLDIPILYLSRYIIENKNDYYKLLQNVRLNNEWENWVLFMLNGIEKTAESTIKTISEIKNLITKVNDLILLKYPKIYSKELLDALFIHPYTKIDFLVEILNIHRETASKYLKNLEEIGILKEMKLNKTKYYINIELYKLLKNI